MVQVKNDTGFAVNVFFVISVAEEGENHSVCAERRLDDVGDVFFARDGSVYSMFLPLTLMCCLRS